MAQMPPLMTEEGWASFSDSFGFVDYVHFQRPSQCGVASFLIKIFSADPSFYYGLTLLNFLYLQLRYN